jgi:hypothetical protein
MIKFASVGMLVAMVVVRTLALLALMKFLAVPNPRAWRAVFGSRGWRTDERHRPESGRV